MKSFWETFKSVALTVLCLTAIGFTAYDRFVPKDPDVHTVNGETLGRAYAPILLDTYADAWTAAASKVQAGGTIADAQKTLQDTWKDARVKAFNDKVTPGMAFVLPAGTEPSDPAKRLEVANLWLQFAKGLKRGH